MTRSVFQGIIWAERKETTVVDLYDLIVFFNNLQKMNYFEFNFLCNA